MRCAALLVAALASACSPIFIKKAPPELEPLQWPRCTEHRLYPLVDVTYAGLWAGLTHAAATSDDELGSLGLFITLPMLLGHTVSAIYGLNQSGRCRRARAAYEAAALEGR